ncbi:ribonuclease P protein component [Spirosoma rhododendri]|uniref:ribonuclease P protein component n=1 Tax=Spirosoma rhododendri TaxID=2728024 RepID=UPI0020C4602E|nr:ribonuclease P protein component [Spirosoma rhododendri]
MRQTFTKSERLCSKKILGELFTKGSTAVGTFYLFPFRVLYLNKPEAADALPAIVITVPKRQFKRAVDRNLIRRRVREAYRLNKHLLFPPTVAPAPCLRTSPCFIRPSRLFRLRR